VPVVATNAGATADLVTPETGFLTEPGDVRTLATSIVKILGDPELARRLGRAGHELVAAKHSIDGHCVRLEAILREIAGR
jgi:glycosyltransferase involved in cell wall biosynthesis